MPEAKNLSMSIRVSPRFKRLLEAAAARECRSQTNMLEMLLYAYCEAHGLDATPKQTTENKTQTGGLAK